MAECGVRTEAADMSASAGNDAVTGVDSTRVGLREGMVRDAAALMRRERGQDRRPSQANDSFQRKEDGRCRCKWNNGTMSQEQGC